MIATRKGGEVASESKLEAQNWLDGPIGTTLANLSHELKTPLNSILGHSQLLARDPSLSEKARKRLSAIERSGHHLLNLVNAFLDASVERAPELQLQLSPSATISLVEDVVSMFEREAHLKGLDLSYRLASDTPSHVLADNGKIRQILINLVGNAVKYTERGGVHILVRATNLHDDDCMLRIEVMDTGPGIGAEEMPLLFKRHVRGANRTDVDGVGLGLAISRHNARLLGGSLSVESGVGRGSIFRLIVPVTWLHYAEAGAEPVDAPATSRRPLSSYPSGTFQKHSSAGPLAIPGDMLELLLAAARAGDASALSELTDELSDDVLANHVRLLAESYDYQSIIELVATVPRASGDES